MSRSTTDKKPSLHPPFPRGHSLTACKLIILFLAVYLLMGLYSPMPSERAYLAWPPTVIIGWLMLRGPKRLQKRHKLYLLAGGFMVGALLAYDFRYTLRGLQRGEIFRVTWCLFGLMLLVALLKNLFYRLTAPLTAGDKNTVLRRLGVTLPWILLLAVFLQPYLLSYMQIHPLKRRVDETPRGALRIDYEEFSWESTDGTLLRGWFVGSGSSNRMAVVCHGVMDTKAGMMDFIQGLHSSDYNVVVFDMRGHGQSDRWTVTYGPREKEDIISLIDYLKQRRPVATQRIVGVAWSMGASSLILAAAQDQRIEAVFVDSPYASTRDMARHIGSSMPRWMAWWNFYVGTAIGSLEVGHNLFEFDISESAKAISPRPIMIVHGTRDEVIPIEQGRRVFEAAKEPKWFHAIEGAGHCQTTAVDTEYVPRMVQFLNSSLEKKRD